MMRRLRYVLPLVLLLLPTVQANAAPIFYDFTVTFDSTFLSGSFDGNFSVDGDQCPSGICDGVFTPALLQELLSFDITIDGFAFDITDDAGYPTLPVVIFDNGALESVLYGTALGPPPYFAMFYGNTVNSVQFVGANGALNGGFVSSITQRDAPEPVTMTLLGIGLAGAAVRSRRRKSA